MRRRVGRDARAWIGSALVHGSVVAVAWLTSVVEPRPMEFQTFQVQMVSAPQVDELVVETPDPSPTPPPVEETEPPPVVEKPPEPKPREPEPEPEPAPKPPEPEPKPDPAPRESEPDPARSPENIDVRMEGLRRDFPEYYANIVFQMRRCFRPPSGGGRNRATIDFVIQKDGSIPPRDIDIQRSSGSLELDLAAVEAVECAGGKVGPLPDDLRLERLPVRFNFSPSGNGTVETEGISRT